MTEAFLGLGGNLGDRAALLAEALRRLDRPGVLEIAAVSSVYETKAVGLTDQPDFLNLVAKIRTSLPPHELLRTALEVEAALGRVRVLRWGPRTIDIDLLCYGDIRLADAALTLPHPRLGERGFVLVPLAEIAPQLPLPGGDAAALAAQCDRGGLQKLGPFVWRNAAAAPLAGGGAC